MGNCTSNRTSHLTGQMAKLTPLPLPSATRHLTDPLALRDVTGAMLYADPAHSVAASNCAH